jgi:hypothetical protein
MNVLTASVSGEDISDPASDSKIAKVLGLKPRRLFGGKTNKNTIFGNCITACFSFCNFKA